MNIKFVPNLFLEVVELERFKDSLDKQGFRKNLKENTERFGLIKNDKSDPSFLNGKVERDLDDSNNNKTIKIKELFAIDQFGRFVYQPEQRSIPIPNDSNWHWVRVRYKISTLEKGTFSISANGNLVGSPDAELTKIFRGQPNFPTRIKFSNSPSNTLEYDVLDIIDDQHATLQHPSLNGGLSQFVAESDLTFSIVGTFTPGVAINPGDKFPFEYDYAETQLIVETSPNTRPSYIPDSEFYLARVKVVGSNLVIQDKRIEYWETKGSQRCIDIDRTVNPLIGVESIKWNSQLTAADRNIVEVAWGMRSQNWSIDSSQNILTLFGSAIGGKFKSPTDFTDGDFDGWRVYTTQRNGKYSRVISSVKQGAAINLLLDILDVDDYSSDGGVTFDASSNFYVLVVPDADSIDIKFIPNPGDEQPYMEKVFNFPINSLTGKCEVVPYLDTPNIDTDICTFNVQYRYKSYKDFTQYQPIPSDTVNGFWSERSFNKEDGNFKPDIGDRIQKTYTSYSVAGFIELEVCPWSVYRFKGQVYKGDVIGVTTINSLPITLVTLTVGTSDRYQHLVGNITLPGDDVYFKLDKTGAVEGNEFRIHIDCISIDLVGKSIIIAQEATGGVVQVLKTVGQGDVYMMKNIDGGLVFDCVFDDNGNWIIYQNYDTGRPGEIVTLDGVISNLFDSSSKMGKVKGLYGFSLCDSSNSTPNLVGRFIVGSGGTPSNYPVGETGGQANFTITRNNIPPHSHRYVDGYIQARDGTGPFFSQTLESVVAGMGNQQLAATGAGMGIDEGSGSTREAAYSIRNTGSGVTNVNGELEINVDGSGNSTPIDNRPPYYALIYAKKLF